MRTPAGSTRSALRRLPGRRGSVIAVVLVFAAVLAGCSGNTTGATRITTTSATLNTTGSCGSNEQCKWYWEYWRADQPRSTGTKTPVNGPAKGPVPPVKLSADITGLTAGTTYRWVACGSPDNGSSFFCVGPKGASKASVPTADPPADYATFVTHATGGKTGMVYVNDTGLVLASSTATNPVQRTTALDGQPDWSPDATKLVFGRGRPNALAQDVWRVNADGTGLKQLTFAGNDGDPAWSPDGTRIAYFSPTPNTNGKLGIWVMNPDGTGQTELTPTSLGFARSPTWSPDSTRIAFACSAGSVTELCTMNADGSGLVHLTGPQSVIDVSWSRDGTTLAFAASGPSGPGLYAIHPDGTGLVLLRAGRPDTSVSWSPDSRKIAFDATPNGVFASDLYTMNANGSGVVDLTNTPQAGENFPVFSPLP